MTFKFLDFKNFPKNAKIRILDDKPAPQIVWIGKEVLAQQRVNPILDYDYKDFVSIEKPIIPKKVAVVPDYLSLFKKMSNGRYNPIYITKGRTGIGKSFALSKIFYDLDDIENPAKLMETDGSHYLMGDHKYYPILISRKIREKAIEWMIEKKIAYVERKVSIRGYRLAFDIIDNKQNVLRFKLCWSDG